MDYKTAITATLSGDEDGFTYLYESTYADMFHKALSYTKNKCDAEDVLQDSYIKARRSLETLSDPEKFPYWLGSIVSRTAVNYLKKKKPLLFFGGDDSENEDFNFYDIQDDNNAFQPEEAYNNKETNKILHEMIDSLSDEQRICIIMFHFNQLSIHDIADIISCPESTVKSRLTYGRKALRKKVEAMEKDGYRFYGGAPIPILKYFMTKNSTSAGFLKTAKASMECTKEIAFSTQGTVDGATVTIFKRSVGKRLLATLLSTVAIGGGMFSVFKIPWQNGFVNLWNYTNDTDNISDLDNIYIINDNNLSKIAGNLTYNELIAVLEALPDDYKYEQLRTAEYFDLVNFFCYKIKDNFVTSSAVTDKGYIKVKNINRMFSSFSNYIVYNENCSEQEYHQSPDGDSIEYDTNKKYINASVKIINISYINGDISIIFSRTYDIFSGAGYAVNGGKYSSGKKYAFLEQDSAGYYRIRSIQDYK